MLFQIFTEKSRQFLVPLIKNLVVENVNYHDNYLGRSKRGWRINSSIIKEAELLPPNWSNIRYDRIA